MSGLHVLSITLDCEDPDQLAGFYSQLLGLQEDYAATDRSAVALRGSGFLLGFLKVADYRPPTWPAGDVPKQMHLDLDSRDLEGDVRTAVALGATLVDEQPHPERWRVLLDPAGHPFCLTTSNPEQ